MQINPKNIVVSESSQKQDDVLLYVWTRNSKYNEIESRAGFA